LSRISSRHCNCKVGWRCDENAASPVSEQELLGYEPGFDGLPKPDVIGDQQPDTRHAQSASKRFQLVCIDLDAALERSEELTGIGLRRGPPPDCV
jgi:hypothetical protein